MSEITEAALRVAEAERDFGFADGAAQTARNVADSAFERLQEARDELGAAVREQTEKARDYVNGADKVADECCDDAPEPPTDESDDDCESIEDSFGQARQAPHVEIHLHAPFPL
jgi:hypothetical protein